jgi:hypothetical protein
MLIPLFLNGLATKKQTIDQTCWSSTRLSIRDRSKEGKVSLGATAHQPTG